MGIFSLEHEQNLAQMPGVEITASVMQPVGGGAPHPGVLLNERAHRLDGLPLREFRQGLTFDTFHGREGQRQIDWYAITFPKEVPVNCIELTMGIPFRDGGWWTSLNVETRNRSGGVTDHPWQNVSSLKITPDYDFSDSRSNRRPFETFALTFDKVQASEIRIIGVPGGLASFTSLARLAVYQRDLSRWNPLDLPAAPTPGVFQLISPNAIFDLSENLVKVTGLDANFTMLEYFLDGQRYERQWMRMQPNYLGRPQLWILLGDRMSWNAYNEYMEKTTIVHGPGQDQPHVALSFHRLLATANAPITVNGRSLGVLTSSQAILIDELDLEKHRALARQLDIAWDDYQPALERMPRLTLEQMEGVAGLLGLIANTIAELANRNLALEHELRQVRAESQKGTSGRALVQKAIAYIHDNLDEDLSIAGIASRVGCSPAYFSTLFSEQIGCTPSEFVAQRKIERAKELLGYRQTSVMDVCVALGYTPSYFNRLFKRLVGMTPGEYARRERAQEK